MRKQSCRAMLTLCSCLPALLAAAAQSPSPLDQLVAQLPAGDAAAEQQIMASLVSLGPRAVMDLAERLRPPKTGGDVKERYALTGLATYLAKGNREPQRTRFAAALCRALDAAGDDEVRAFLMQRLRVAGGEESVAPLSRWLHHERLHDPAAQALESIGSRSAQAALLSALDGAQGSARRRIVKALGVLRVKAATPQLMPLAKSQDRDLRLAAVRALADIGSPAAAAAIRDGLHSSPLAKAVGVWQRYITRLARNGEQQAAMALCRQWLHDSTAPQHLRASALSQLVDLAGEDATFALLDAVRDGGPALQAAALSCAARLPQDWVTRAFARELPVSPDDTQVKLLRMLAPRGREAARAIAARLESREPLVRVAAVDAARRCLGVAALPKLLATTHGDRPETTAAVQSTLLRMPAAPVTEAILSALPELDVDDRPAMLKVVELRARPDDLPTVLRWTADEDARVRQAAWRAAGGCASGAQADELLQRYLAVTDADTLASAADAIVSVCRRRDASAVALPVIKAMGSVSPAARPRLLALLPRLGGGAALQTVLQTVLHSAMSSDVPVRDAALRALSEWPESAALTPLLQILERIPPGRLRSGVLAGAVRLAVQTKDLTERVKLLSRMLDSSRDADEQRLLLRSVGSARCAAALNLAQKWLQRSTARDAAAETIVGLATPVRGKPAVSYAAARSALQQVAKLGPQWSRRAEAALAALPPPESWNLALGKPVTASGVHEGDHVPERAVDGNFRDPTAAWYCHRCPCWLQVDLQQTVRVEAVRAYFYWSDRRYYQYRVELSTNAKQWLTVVDMSKNTQPATPMGVLSRFAPTPARYVRIHILKNSANPAAHLVELQVFGEGAAPKPPATPKPDAEGFISLFNGKNLDGWIGSVNGYYVDDQGNIVCDPKRGGNLYYGREFSDFILRFEFRLPPGGNNGLGIRCPLGGGAYDGIELQILDNSSPRYAKLQPYQYHGSVYGVIPAKRGFLKPVGEWNHQEVIVRGRRVKVILNGTVIVDGDLDQASKGGTMDHRPHSGLKRDRGYIGFLGHGAPVAFRNIRIKELTDSTSP